MRYILKHAKWNETIFAIYTGTSEWACFHISHQALLSNDTHIVESEAWDLNAGSAIYLVTLEHFWEVQGLAQGASRDHRHGGLTHWTTHWPPYFMHNITLKNDWLRITQWPSLFISQIPGAFLQRGFPFRPFITLLQLLRRESSQSDGVHLDVWLAFLQLAADVWLFGLPGQLPRSQQEKDDSHYTLDKMVFGNK